MPLARRGTAACHQLDGVRLGDAPNFVITTTSEALAAQTKPPTEEINDQKPPTRPLLRNTGGTKLNFWH